MLLREKSRFFDKILVLFIMATLVAFVFLASLTGTIALAADNENQPSLEAISALLVDARRGQVVYTKSADEHVKTPLANLITALIALENHPDAMVTGNEAISGKAPS